MRLSALFLHGAPPAMLELAPQIERLGYRRFWIAENQPQMSAVLASSIVAGLTTSIRVGTAAVLAHFYPPFALAQDFQFLELCYPGRIDLGFCASWIGDPQVLDAMLDGRDPARQREAYADRIARLVELVRRPRTDPELDPAAGRLIAGPPALWSMGTGPGSAALAATHGLGFAYSVFHSMSGEDPSIVGRYRDEFRPSWARRASEVIVATAGVCAETDAEARAQAEAWRNPHHLPRIVGSPESCRRQLEALQQRYGADEIVFADLVGDGSRRAASYQMLAEACGLERREDPEAAAP